MDTLFLTPTGFKKNIDLSVGDKVCNPDGTTSTIVQTHPIEKRKNMYYILEMVELPNVVQHTYGMVVGGILDIRNLGMLMSVLLQQRKCLR